MTESENHFSLTRVAPSASERAKSQIRITISSGWAAPTLAVGRALVARTRQPNRQDFTGEPPVRDRLPNGPVKPKASVDTFDIFM
jgi:hypothetical protein